MVSVSGSWFKSQEISLTPFFYKAITQQDCEAQSGNFAIHPPDFITLSSCWCFALQFPGQHTKRLAIKFLASGLCDYYFTIIVPLHKSEIKQHPNDW